MNRETIFNAIKAARGKGFSSADVLSIDAFLDSMDVPREAHGRRLVSREGIKMMHDFEGCVLEAYPDPGSKDGHPWTIGYGATGEGIKRGVRWTQAQADARFEEDVARFAEGVAKLLGDAPTTPRQFDALVSLGFNIGLHALGNSTVLREHKKGNYEAAANAFGRFKYNDGKVMNGLVRRRAAEAAHYRGSH